MEDSNFGNNTMEKSLNSCSCSDPGCTKGNPPPYPCPWANQYQMLYYNSFTIHATTNCSLNK